MTNLIKNTDGTITECAANIANMGVIKSAITFYGYSKIHASIVGIVESKSKLEALVPVAIMTILFPIMPLLRAWSEVNSARRIVKATSQRRARFMSNATKK